MSTKRLQCLTVIVHFAVVCGVLVRLAGFNRKSLWVDEVFAGYRVSAPTAGGLLSGLRTSPSPPLYYLTLWVWVHVLGVRDSTIRLLPLVLGLAALPVIYRVWGPLLGRRGQLWAVALVALNAYAS